jgi:colanic acid biosynthesis glycosyl transferase WcaI
MRILIYGINFAPELTGIGKFTGEMAHFLVQKGHEVHMITAPPYYPQWRILPGYAAKAYRTEVWQGITVLRCPLWVPSNRGQINGVQRLLHLASFAASSLPIALAQIRWHPDRVIVLAPAIFNAPAAALVARISGAKSWLHIQDFELDAALGLKILPGLGAAARLVQQAERALYLSFDCVSTISTKMQARIIEKGVDPNRAILFPNWVDTRQIYPINGYNPLRRDLALEEKQFVILYSGNMGQKQGLEVVVGAARKLVNDQRLLFLLCGEGAAHFHLAQMASDLPNVRFLPLQPIHRLNELLNLADIHVLPQSAGAADLVMPSKLTGMLASGRPVIATAHPGTELADVIDRVGLLVPPGRPDCLAEAISSLLNQPDLRTELGRRGRAFAEQAWSKDIVLKNFLDTLTAL